MFDSSQKFVLSTAASRDLLRSSILRRFRLRLLESLQLFPPRVHPILILADSFGLESLTAALYAAVLLIQGRQRVQVVVEDDLLGDEVFQGYILDIRPD